ncbi:MAG: PhoX family phosphatase [Halopseudomonas sp.]|uniref:PhoX family protein n=1 Tax=Halopseudomonas sp. TaxID=2901191 RepID=UPI003002CEED
MKQDQQFHHRLEALDDRIVNATQQPSLNKVVSQGRRNLLKGGAALALFSLFPSLPSPLAKAVSAEHPRTSLLNFQSVEAITSSSFDSVIVPPGYLAQAFFSWGDGVMPNAPAWRDDASNSWQDQLLQAGDNHDGMHFFPFAETPNQRGLLVINHEYVNPTLHPEGMAFVNQADGKRTRPAEQVRKELAAHGLSVIEIAKDSNDQWQRVARSPFNRRISGYTRFRVSAPLAGDARMKTASNPSGDEILGTLNNCSMGVTPWGTYLACEENFHNYFVNRDEQDYAQRPEHKRYGIGLGGSSRYYAWESVEARFDATPDATQPHHGHVNEPNRFGWVVELDPFAPQSAPIKRTAMGRLGRECAVCSLGDDGRMAFYSGDDARGEYLYKFVPAGAYHPGEPEHNANLLDSGTLYAAQFQADGRGRWLPLRFGDPGLTAQDGFADQQAVLLNSRGAADAIGATPMDRPEWVAVHPHTREAYVSLTNNTDRGKVHPTDAANPRAENLHGQILRWREAGANPTAEEFEWDIFVLAGERQHADQSIPANRVGNISGDLFSSPDGMAFDSAGRLWILTDADETAPYMGKIGSNQMLCADPVSREVRRFLVGPWGAEITGITWSPDETAMWINVQHPGISYPASDGHSRPRSTTVLITREDGGIIGC